MSAAVPVLDGDFRRGVQAGLAVGGKVRRTSTLMRMRNSISRAIGRPALGGRGRSASVATAPPRYFALFKPPRQMHHWGQPQPHPHTNWFDLFFDLIFVGAAFQLGTLLEASCSAEGVLYFASLFLSLYCAWLNKLGFDARVDADDLMHKALDIVEALSVCAAALHIGSGSARHTPVQDMQDRDTGHAWGFSVCGCLLRLLHCLRWWEVYKVRETQGSIAISWAMLIWKFKAALIYLGAALLSHARWTPDAHRNGACLAWLLATVYEQHVVTLNMFCPRLMRWGFRFTRETTIPMNISYVLHRNGEWVMLMIGESMLSLVVGFRLDATLSYYTVFCCGFLSAASLQFLHYSTQPFEPEEHAMRIHGKSGLLWSHAISYYSAALIAFGSSIKVLMLHHGAAQLEQKFGWLACGSLALSFLLIQCMHTAHGGLDQLVVDCGWHESLPSWLFDTSKPHRGNEGAKSAMELGEEEQANTKVALRRRKAIALTKLSLLIGLAVLPLAKLRTVVLSMMIALWCLSFAVLEALTRSTAMSHSTHGGHHHEHDAWRASEVELETEHARLNNAGASDGAA
jgi:low temperature requirement protein LtrA